MKDYLVERLTTMEHNYKYYCQKCENEWEGTEEDIYCCGCDSVGFVITDEDPTDVIDYPDDI